MKHYLGSESNQIASVFRDRVKESIEHGISENVRDTLINIANILNIEIRPPDDENHEVDEHPEKKDG